MKTNATAATRHLRSRPRKRIVHLLQPFIEITPTSTHSTARQAARRKRELERKSRALDILLRDDWANAVLARVRETRATRLQLAQAEADREAQLDAMVGLAVDGQPAADENEPGGAIRGQDRGDAGSETKHDEEGGSDNFVGASGGGVEINALQVRWEA